MDIPNTLLFKESPIITVLVAGAIAISYYYDYQAICLVLIILLLFLIYFYRYYPSSPSYPDFMLVSPASGTITKIAKNDTHCFISIFLSPFDIHTQVYPANGTLLHSYYDETGVFNIVTDADKSKFNEKAIHFMLLPDDTVIKFTQIAGFLPRRIVYKGKPGDKVSAGHHMGMIKFGSRVDILFPLKSATDGNFILDKDLKVGKVLELGDHLGHYTSMEGFRFGIAESVYEAEPIIGRDGLYLNALYSNNVKN